MKRLDSMFYSHCKDEDMRIPGVCGWPEIAQLISGGAQSSNLGILIVNSVSSH